MRTKTHQSYANNDVGLALYAWDRWSEAIEGLTPDAGLIETTREICYADVVRFITGQDPSHFADRDELERTLSPGRRLLDTLKREVAIVSGSPEPKWL